MHEVPDRLSEGVAAGNPLVWAKVGLDDPLNLLGDLLLSASRWLTLM